MHVALDFTLPKLIPFAFTGGFHFREVPKAFLYECLHLLSSSNNGEFHESRDTGWCTTTPPAMENQRNGGLVAVAGETAPSPLSRMRLSSSVRSISTINVDTFKSLLSRHQGVVSVLQYLTRAGVMFLPSSMELYEVAVEGCYSTSQLITFLNSTILEDTWERSTGLEDCMVLVTRAISHIEVLAEKLALALGGEYRRSQMAWLIELLKAVCRLAMLADRRKPTLLLHWGLLSDPDEIKLDLSHYVRWYTRTKPPEHFVRLSMSQPAALMEEKEEPLELLPLAPSQVIQTSTLLKHARTFQGKRSGLVLNVPGLCSSAGISASGSATSTDAAGASAMFASNSAGGNSFVETVPGPATGGNKVRGVGGGTEPTQTRPTADGAIAQSSSGSYIECLTTYIGLPFQTGGEGSEEMDRGMTVDNKSSANGSVQPATAPTSTSPSPAAVPIAHAPQLAPSELQASMLHSKIDAKYLIYLGEILYALRPAIYAWALHRVDRMYGAAGAAASASPSNNGTGGDALGGAYAGGDPDDHSRWVPSGNRAPHRQRQQERGSLWGRTMRRVQANLWPSSLIGTVSRLRSGYAAAPAPSGGSYGREIDIAVATAVAMMVEVASVQLTTMGLKLAREEAARCGAPASEGDSTTTNLHAFDKELQRRKLALLYYFLRSPLFDRTTLPLLEVAATLVARIPLLGGLPASAIGLVRYLNRTHFYTSASS